MSKFGWGTVFTVSYMKLKKKMKRNFTRQNKCNNGRQEETSGKCMVGSHSPLLLRIGLDSLLLLTYTILRKYKFKICLCYYSQMMCIGNVSVSKPVKYLWIYFIKTNDICQEAKSQILQTITILKSTLCI